MKVKIETTMTDYESFVKSRERILKIAQGIMDMKQPEYTNDNEDVLYNFKTIAEMMKVPTEQVWATFFFKHVQAIMTHASEPEFAPAEPIQSRFADAINYLFLGYALLCEQNKFPKRLTFHENEASIDITT
tara:strand:- start:177 stop:569 length:393 start_codon:yes stop_codon:yes gene_type:complete